MRQPIGLLTIFAASIVLICTGCGASTKEQTTATVPVPQSQPTDAMTNPSDTTKTLEENTAMAAKVDSASSEGAATNLAIGVTANTNVNTALKTQLEASYNNLVQVIASGDKDGFVMIMDPEKKSPSPTDDQWKQALPVISKTFPALSTTQFLKIDQKNETRAYYYYLTNLQDKSYTSVNVAIFNKINGEWKISGNIFSSNFPKSSDEAKEKEAIVKATASLSAKADNAE